MPDPRPNQHVDAAAGPNPSIGDRVKRYFRNPANFSGGFTDSLLLVIGFFAIILVVRPQAIDDLLSEDGIIEIITGGLAGFGAVLALLAFRARRERAFRAKALLFGALFLFVGLEENDWGIRLFKRRNEIHDVNLNTFHELIELALKPEAEWYWKAAGIAVVVAGVVGVGLAVWFRGLRVWPLNGTVWDRTQRLVLLGVIFYALGQLRDLGVTPVVGLPYDTYEDIEKLVLEHAQGTRLHVPQGRFSPRGIELFGAELGTHFPEEVVELLGGLVFFFAGWSLYLDGHGLILPGERLPSGEIWKRIRRFTLGHE